MRVSDATWTQGRAVIAGSNNWITSGAVNAPTEWKGTLQGTDPGFVSLATGDLRPAGTSPLANAANPAPEGPAGFAFPSPAFPPVFSPPFHVVSDALPRPVAGTLDIGAYEFGATAGLVGERDADERRIRAGAWRDDGVFWFGPEAADALGRPGSPTPWRRAR